MTVVEILTKAREKIVDPAHYHQGVAIAVDASGKPTPWADDVSAVRWSGLGAIVLVCGRFDREAVDGKFGPIIRQQDFVAYQKSVELLSKLFGAFYDEEGVWHSRRNEKEAYPMDVATHAEMIAAFDVAISQVA